MFQNLSERLGAVFGGLRGKARLTEDNIAQSMREIRMALLEADVALPVVKKFIADVKQRAVGAEVLRSLTPDQALVKVVHQELVGLMGGAAAELNIKAAPPAIILLAGLQGAGKTTTAAKLAVWLKTQLKKKLMLVSADVYRPAAITQLQRLAKQHDVMFYDSTGRDDPAGIVADAKQEARKQFADVLIVDTAGRLHVDADMMEEIRTLHRVAEPVETLFIVDGMTGQDAANTSRAFGEALPLTGIIITKLDGDARGGAALSTRQITGAPVKFIGLGEKVDALEVFHPERVASRILGMGDVLSLVEEVEQKVDRAEADKLARKLKKGKGFNLEDFRAQLEQLETMGGLENMLEKLPGGRKLPQAAAAQFGNKEVRRQLAIIQSMTKGERRRPDIINGSRKRRIANGSGTDVQTVNRLLKQFTQMQKMMKKFSKGGMRRLMGGLKGGLPPGMGGF
ncbi:MAG: signal recognition particle protein [Gammaproteobacteria bacterium]|nr:signal recognition particle protein [Gammaproteobacteria bacterium]